LRGFFLRDSGSGRNCRTPPAGFRFQREPQGRSGARDLGGPIKIAEVSGEAASLGIVPLVNLMALLSVSLGLLNLFPVPLLDGGHLMFYAAEAIRGRPLPARAQEYGFRAGFALLIGLFVFATWNDIAHGAIGRWVAGLVS
jgi:regulator of sigma E protease